LLTTLVDCASLHEEKAPVARKAFITLIRELTEVDVRSLDQDALERYFMILKRCRDERAKELPEWGPCLGLVGRFRLCVAGGGVVGGVRVGR